MKTKDPPPNSRTRPYKYHSFIYILFLFWFSASAQRYSLSWHLGFGYFEHSHPTHSPLGPAVFSFNVAWLGFICVIALTELIHLYCYLKFHHVNISQLFHSPVDGHLDSFCLGGMDFMSIFCYEHFWKCLLMLESKSFLLGVYNI